MRSLTDRLSAVWLPSHHVLKSRGDAIGSGKASLVSRHVGREHNRVGVCVCVSVCASGVGPCRVCVVPVVICYVPVN